MHLCFNLLFHMSKGLSFVSFTADVEWHRHNHLTEPYQGLLKSRVMTLKISNQLSENDKNVEKQNLMREVEVIVERKVYVEIPTEVIKKLEVIKEVFIDGAVRGLESFEDFCPFPTALSVFRWESPGENMLSSGILLGWCCAAVLSAAKNIY